MANTERYWTAEQYREYLRREAEADEAAKRNKYNRRKTEYAGIIFDSALEAQRYAELRMLERAGKISGLQRQVPFRLPGGVIYKCDFRYEENGVDTVEESKGFWTPEARIKAKQFVEAYPGIRFLVNWEEW